jgi:thiosulfate/3-mercaptopyruvate sulfurtransferase
MSDLPLLVDAEQLVAALDDPSLRVLDATVWLQIHPDGSEVTIESGRAAFDEGHIPGAGFADLIELSDPERPTWFMLPEADRFSDGMSRLGVGSDTHVVAYDAEDGIWAARLWWMLRAFGFDAVSLLDGGLEAWRAAGLPLSTETRDVPRRGFEARLRPELVASREDVEAVLHAGGACLVNALPPELFRGEVPIVPGRFGHIPGSVNVPTESLIDPESNRFLPVETLRGRFDEAGVLDQPRVIAYCGGAIAATFDAFALALLGRDDVAVYDGSLVEWASDPELPLDRS